MNASQFRRAFTIFNAMHHPEENPWKITSEKNVYDNPWINVTEYQVINPSGNPGIYGKVHFKNIAIGVLPLDDELNTYLVGQFRFPLNQYSWEMPEGGGPEGTDPLESAKRELLEETGLKASQWTEIQRMHLSNSVSDELSIIYLARELTQFEAEPEDTEQLTIHKIPFAQMYQMVCDGLITDSMTVAAVLKVQLLLAENRL
ncbi:8-oxo-dGTP pyrophosphatase MutT, NUDIX family [Mucilaginibacter sp. OK268]|nr:8-oxo-dGTP pyrophosphatase MutT, NUDIX family [Mucilaginibacter sp. OK268]